MGVSALSCDSFAIWCSLFGFWSLVTNGTLACGWFICWGKLIACGTLSSCNRGCGSTSCRLVVDCWCSVLGIALCWCRCSVVNCDSELCESWLTVYTGACLVVLVATTFWLCLRAGKYDMAGTTFREESICTKCCLIKFKSAAEWPESQLILNFQFVEIN